MNGIFDIYTILFLALAVVIFLRLRGVLGRRTGHERPPFDPYTRTQAPAGDKSAKTGRTRDKVVELPVRGPKPERGGAQAERWKGIAAPGSALASVLDSCAEIDPRFDARHFLDGAKAAYEMIITAFAAGDRKGLQPLLAGEVYDGFVEAISEREQRGESVDTQFIGIDKADIVDGGLKETTGQLTVRFVSKLISVTRSKSGDVVDGDPKTIRDVTDVWTFSRDLASPNPNWKLVATESVA